MQTFAIPQETLGERLRRARMAAGLSSGAMAAELEVSSTSISRWENNRERPHRRTLLAYAMRCSVPIDWLETGLVPEGVGVRSKCFAVAA